MPAFSSVAVWTKSPQFTRTVCHPKKHVAAPLSMVQHRITPAKCIMFDKVEWFVENCDSDTTVTSGVEKGIVDGVSQGWNPKHGISRVCLVGTFFYLPQALF